MGGIRDPVSRRGFRSIPREPGARTRDALPNFAATTEANTPGSSCRSPLAQDCLCVLAGGTFLPRTTCRRGGAVRSARQVKRGFTAVPDKDGSVTNTEGLISKHLFHRLYNSNSIASKTHEHYHARGRKPPTHAGAHRRPRERHRAANLRSNLCL